MIISRVWWDGALVTTFGLKITVLPQATFFVSNGNEFIMACKYFPHFAASDDKG